MILLITGSRKFTDRDFMVKTFSMFAREHEEFDEIIHGGAKGADLLADEICYKMGIRTTNVRPDYEGCLAKGIPARAAPFLRNQRMVDMKPDWCLPFYVEGLPCNGTKDCVRRAMKARIPIFRCTESSSLFL